jgi:DNA-binding LacI/PurR family transcriptional regulator
VSRVINGNYPVSEALRARVQKAMDDLAYQPNTLARGLRRQKTQSIGVLIPKLNDQFLGTLGYTIEKTLFDNGYRALLCSTEEALERETAYIDSLLQQQVDGVIMFPREHSRENVKRLLNAGVPVLLVERELKHLPVHHVLVNNYAGGYQAVRHLIDLGHRDIALMTAVIDPYPIQNRLDGALAALRDAKLTLPHEYMMSVRGGEPRFQIGYRFGQAVARLPKRPTAIFALTDELAVGAMHALTENGIRVPEDMSIIGFDNIPLASFVIPALTTVEQPASQIGEMAGTILLRSLQGGSEKIESVTLETTLIVRDSTAAR